MQLTADMRQILAEMEVWVSYGSVANWSPTGVGAPGSRIPAPIGEPMHLAWRERFLRAPVHRCEVVEDEARAELQAFRKRAEAKIVVEGQAELDARIIEEGEDWSVDEVALHCRTTPTIVRKARLKAGVDTHTGKPLLRRNLPRIERADEAQRMRGEGRTIRQIAMLLRCDPMTIHRDLQPR